MVSWSSLEPQSLWTGTLTLGICLSSPGGSVICTLWTISWWMSYCLVVLRTVYVLLYINLLCWAGLASSRNWGCCTYQYAVSPPPVPDHQKCQPFSCLFPQAWASGSLQRSTAAAAAAPGQPSTTEGSGTLLVQVPGAFLCHSTMSPMPRTSRKISGLASKGEFCFLSHRHRRRPPPPPSTYKSTRKEKQR